MGNVSSSEFSSMKMNRIVTNRRQYGANNVGFYISSRTILSGFSDAVSRIFGHESTKSGFFLHLDKNLDQQGDFVF